MNPSPLQLALAVPLRPVIAAGLIGLIPPLRRRAALASGVSILAALLSLSSAVTLLVSGVHVFERVRWLPVAGKTLAEAGLRVDGTSAPMLVVVGLVALLVQIYSLGYLAGEPEAHRGRYFTWQSLFLFSMQGFVLSPNLLQLFAFYELVGLCSYLLIGYYHERPSAGRASVKAFWITKLGDVGFLIGLLVAWSQYRSFDLATIQAAVSSGHVAANAWFLPALLFCGVASKSAQVPLHVWLPDAMEGPTPVSALLHAATMVAAGVYLLVSSAFLFAASPALSTVVMYVGAVTAIFAAVLGASQTDLKRVLAYSTCSQLGLMVAAIGSGAVLAGYFHLVTHAFFKALLFLAAGSAIHSVHTNDVRAMGGLGRSMRATSILFAIGVLALSGIPPLSGFFSKELIVSALAEHPLALALVLATTLLTPYYMGRAFLLAFAGTPRSEAAQHAHESGPTLLLPMVVLAVPALLAGLLLTPFGKSIGVEGEHAHFHFGVLGAVAVALSLCGLAAAWVLHSPRAGSRVDRLPAGVLALARGGAIDKLYVFGWKRVLFLLALITSFVDRYLVDGVMNLVGWATEGAGRRLRRVQTGVVHDYVFVLFLALIALVAWGLWKG